MIRLNKYIASCGICSRRQADKLISDKEIFVNGKIALLGTSINPKKDKVTYQNQLISQKKLVYYAFNKPAGFISTTKDPFATKTIASLWPKNERIFFIGRLDKETEGLMILTNDGDLAYKLSHPKFKHTKEYEIVCKIIKNSKKPVNILRQFVTGISLDEGLARVDKIQFKSYDQNNKIITFSLVLHQGWKRQIRRMCDNVGLKVLKLKRVRIANYKLDNLAIGKYIPINKKDII